MALKEGSPDAVILAHLTEAGEQMSDPDGQLIPTLARETGFTIPQVRGALKRQEASGLLRVTASRGTGTTLIHLVRPIPTLQPASVKPSAGFTNSRQRSDQRFQQAHDRIDHLEGENRELKRQLEEVEPGQLKRRLAEAEDEIERLKKRIDGALDTAQHEMDQARILRRQVERQRAVIKYARDVLEGNVPVPVPDQPQQRELRAVS